VIAGLYARLQQAPDLLAENALGGDGMAGKRLLAAGKPILRLDELPVTGTITRRWPPVKLDYSAVNLMTAEMPDLSQPPPTVSNSSRFSAGAMNSGPTSSTATAADDETEEMDALPEPQPSQDKEQKE
jgi:hypothetical protein